VVAVIEEVELDDGDSPIELVALTTKVYAVFDCKPLTVIGEVDPVLEALPGVA
jgi:hypothetical protein